MCDGLYLMPEIKVAQVFFGAAAVLAILGSLVFGRSSVVVALVAYLGCVAPIAVSVLRRDPESLAELPIYREGLEREGRAPPGPG